jgi:hypothetical protein
LLLFFCDFFHFSDFSLAVFEIGELQEQIKQTTALVNDAKSNLRTTESNNKKKESGNQRAERENQASLKTCRDLVDKLNETEVRA